MTLLLAILLIPAGCTTRITPPANVHDPVNVYLLDHGRTCSLVLPIDGDRFVRYAYGDWRWYALDNTSLFSGFRAVMWPTPGALGRREFVDLPRADVVRQRVTIETEHQYEIAVERAKVRSLHAKLTSLFHQNADTLTPSRSAALEFVHHPRRYWLAHNSNHAAADWLRQLGCKVRGPTLLSTWRVDPPPDR